MSLAVNNVLKLKLVVETVGLYVTLCVRVITITSFSFGIETKLTICIPAVSETVKSATTVLDSPLTVTVICV